MIENAEKTALIKKALLINWILIVYNVIEAIASVTFGIKAESIALVGFGLDSIIEVLSAAILVWRLSHKGTLEEESKKEKQALFLVGITFFILAAYIGFESILKLWHGDKPEASLAGVIIATLSVLIMPSLGLAKRKIGRKIGSKALEADAMETIICSYLSGVLLVGLALNWLLGWWWADPVAGLLMIYFLVKEGREAVSGDDCRGEKCH